MRVDARQADVGRLRSTDYRLPSAIVAGGSGEPGSLRRIHSSAVMVLLLYIIEKPVSFSHQQRWSSSWSLQSFLVTRSLAFLSFCLRINPLSLDVSVDASSCPCDPVSLTGHLFNPLSLTERSRNNHSSGDQLTSVKLRSVSLTGN